MAILIPENLRSNKAVPEAVRRVASALQTGLDDDAMVWYEPLFDVSSERPHLVVLEPRIGLVMLEVISHKVLGGLRGNLHLEVDGTEEVTSSPLERAERFASAFRDAADEHPNIAGLPVAAVAAFATVTREQADELGVGKVVDLNHCLFKRDLDLARDEGDGAGLIRVFNRARDCALEADLSSAQIDEVRGLIHPDVVIGAKPEQGALFAAANSGSDVVRVMDLRQENMAKTLGSGHRVIRGVAGSGKTLVLVHRARMLSRTLPTQRILVTCFTRSLASQLRGHLAECSNVEVRTLDSVFSDTIRKAGLRHPGYDGPDGEVARLALTALEKNPNTPRFRAVLVDEAQDFDTEALQFCVRLLEASNPDEQDLIVVADSAQKIYERNFTWKAAGINAVGRSQVLRVNYRNTAEILSFAYSFLSPGGLVGDEFEDDDDSAIIPPKSAERSGSEPRVIAANDRRDEVQRVVDAVAGYYGGRSPARSIAVLYGDSPDSFAAELAAALRQRGLPFFWVTDPNNKANRDHVGDADEPIVLSTMKSAKGLEFPAVVACGLGAHANELDSARRLIYVGFTRAINDLTVVVGADSPFREALLKA